MDKLLKVFWIEFGPTLADKYGVTAYTFDDAVNILRQTVFSKEEILPVLKYTEDIKVEDLDQNHVVPNMGVITIRGVWFPSGISS